MKNNKIKSIILIVTLLVGVLIPMPKLNAYTTTPNMEIVYFDYKGIYLTPNDFKNGEALPNYQNYFYNAFSQYLGVQEQSLRFNSDYVDVVFMPLNYVEIVLLSNDERYKLDMLKVSYYIAIDANYELVNVVPTDIEIYVKDINSLYSPVQVFAEEIDYIMGYINTAINNMPNYTNTNEAYFDGYNDGYYDGYGDVATDVYDDGYSDGFIEAVSSVYYDGFGGFINPDTNELYDVTVSYPYGQGYDKGYNEGVASQSDFSFTGILFQVFAGLGALLTIELLPNITIGAIVAVPLVFGIVYFILGKRGGE